jgi:hypothetical protein
MFAERAPADARLVTFDEHFRKVPGLDCLVLAS